MPHDNLRTQLVPANGDVQTASSYFCQEIGTAVTAIPIPVGTHSSLANTHTHTQVHTRATHIHIEMYSGTSLYKYKDAPNVSGKK